MRLTVSQLKDLLRKNIINLLTESQLSEVNNNLSRIGWRRPIPESFIELLEEGARHNGTPIPGFTPSPINIHNPFIFHSENLLSSYSVLFHINNGTIYPKISELPPIVFGALDDRNASSALDDRVEINVNENNFLHETIRQYLKLTRRLATQYLQSEFSGLSVGRHSRLPPINSAPHPSRSSSSGLGASSDGRFSDNSRNTSSSPAFMPSNEERRTRAEPFSRSSSSGISFPATPSQASGPTEPLVRRANRRPRLHSLRRMLQDAVRRVRNYRRRSRAIAQEVVNPHIQAAPPSRQARESEIEESPPLYNGLFPRGNSAIPARTTSRYRLVPIRHARNIPPTYEESMNDGHRSTPPPYDLERPRERPRTETQATSHNSTRTQEQNQER